MWLPWHKLLAAYSLSISVSHDLSGSTVMVAVPFWKCNLRVVIQNIVMYNLLVKLFPSVYRVRQYIKRESSQPHT